MQNDTDALNAAPHTYIWYIALGSNQGDGVQNLQAARRAIRAYGAVEAASPVYETAPMYDTDQARFVNAVLQLRSTLDGPTLLQGLQHVERSFGRERDAGRRYGPRTIDLDIVGGSCDGAPVIEDQQALQVPHPRMHERAFVLVPLSSIVPQWQHPVRDESLQSMLKRAGIDDSLRIVCEPENWA